ncbi:MAG: hypothetical protein QNJ44_21465 [Rhodobacter sp.]|nr:hypothetical protein [Rhodobacter sp.]
MRNDLGNESFKARYLNGLLAVTDRAKEEWRHTVFTPTLREQLFSNQRLEGPIVADVLAHSVNADTDAEEPVAQREELDFLLSSDLDQVMKRAGLVWHADHFLTPDAVGTLLRSCPKIDIEDVRFALRLRSYCSAEVSAGADIAAEIAASGRACVSAWLNHLPAPFPGMLSVLNNPVGDIFRDTVMSVTRAETFAACLQALRQD